MKEGVISKDFPQSLTFDDVLLSPGESRVLPSQVDVSAQLTPKIRLNIPLLSAAMDAVTESQLAIALAREGGMGVIHKNLPIKEQARQISLVKKSESALITDPITMEPHQTIRQALEIRAKHRISGVPVVQDRKVVGILTHRDLRFVRDLDQPISAIMTPQERLVTVPENTTLDRAMDLLQQHRIEKLLVVSPEGELRGMITVKDIEKTAKYPHACKDDKGRLRVGAAVGVAKDFDARVEALLEAGADLIVLDSAHGHSQGVQKAAQRFKQCHPKQPLVAGNVATAEGASYLMEAGADVIKVGVGPGSICTTRIVAGIGVPQLSAILECAKAAQPAGVPLIADGGIKYSGDIVKALAAGAACVMIGSLFAGTDEAPGETVLYQGRAYKGYRGMGSLAAMQQGSRDRYGQAEIERLDKLVPEGIEGLVPSRGPLALNVHQLVGGLRAGLGYTGCATLDELKQRAQFVRISWAGWRESHVHDVLIDKEPPNYHREF
ncbi:MAG TPA: IMP dehydrogenase [Candidatus Bipolaricaulota bacterium]